MLSCEKVQQFKLSKMEQQTEAAPESEEFLASERRKESREVELTESDTKCGFWIFQGEWLQLLASKKSFILIYTLTGTIAASATDYYFGTLSTTEKQYKLSR